MYDFRVQYTTPVSQYKMTNNVFVTKIIKYAVLKMMKTKLFFSYFKVI